MAYLVLMLLLLAMASRSCATWCVCKEGVSDSVLQKTLDYACGAGADCNPTHQNGPCFNPNTVRAHCNYAVNSYFQRNRQIPTACVFSGTATIVTSDPSTAGCMFPATASGSTGTTTPGTTTPTTTTPTTTVPNGGSPLVTNSPTGILGGVNTGLGPSGMNNDISNGWTQFPTKSLISSSIILTFSLLVFW
ncbi:hypothetical protein CDL12_07079 [Handroanthus impetiginosus]|uniref:X8 domain-containing protein n=1 Tax=Handroanthus impetiginosus TaxID=429701 RepID=A0A2G9HRT5_9LAMI|nr:hypothetical protein CDL12_07079 [Handroanthus impetiginosus]